MLLNSVNQLLYKLRNNHINFVDRVWDILSQPDFELALLSNQTGKMTADTQA